MLGGAAFNLCVQAGYYQSGYEVREGDMWMLYFLVPLGIILSTTLVLCLLNKYLPIWFCDHMGWHLEPSAQGFDGCSFKGTCPRCSKKVLQDSQGNWF